MFISIYIAYYSKILMMIVEVKIGMGSLWEKEEIWSDPFISFSHDLQ